MHHRDALAFVTGPECTVAALAAHAEAVRASHHLELFCYGNLSPEATLDLADAWGDALAAEPMAAEQAPMPEAVLPRAVGCRAAATLVHVRQPQTRPNCNPLECSRLQPSGCNPRSRLQPSVEVVEAATLCVEAATLCVEAATPRAQVRQP